MRNLIFFLLCALSSTAFAQVYSEGNGNNAAMSGLGVCQNIYASSYQPMFFSSPDGYGYAGACTIFINGARTGGQLAVYVRDCSAAYTASQKSACAPPAPLVCPYGQSTQNPSGTCQNICPAGQHLENTSAAGDPAINQCVVNLTCPDFSTLVSGTCVKQACPDGQSRIAGLCSPPPADPTCPEGTHAKAGACVGNNPPPLDPCPAGTHNIGADASQPNCAVGAVPPSSSPYVKSGSRSNSDGSTTQTTTTTTVINNADNTQTTTTITNTTNVSAGGTASPTVTSSDSSTRPLTGTKGDANNPDKPKDFCSLHPEVNVCKNSSVAGSCGALQCAGDAIQCASLVEQQRMFCESLTSSTLVDLGKSLLAGNEVPLAGSASVPNVVDLGGMTRLDASPFLGGGACFPDQVFPFYGRTVAIPWSRACDPLAGLRMVVMFLAYFSAYKMLSGVVIRET